MLDWLLGAPLPEGTPAPDFELASESGDTVRLSDLRGNPVVLVFYPGDETPVCRAQLCELRDHWQALKERNIAVFGINPQNSSSHAKFRQKHGLPFPLLVDKGQHVAKKFNAHGPMVRRTVYVIDPDGTIVYSARGKPSPDTLLQQLRARP